MMSVTEMIVTVLERWWGRMDEELHLEPEIDIAS